MHKQKEAAIETLNKSKQVRLGHHHIGANNHIDDI